MSKYYPSDNYYCYMEDSSNHVKYGAIGIPEQMQERAKEEKAKQEQTVIKRIINYLMGDNNVTPE